MKYKVQFTLMAACVMLLMSCSKKKDVPVTPPVPDNLVYKGACGNINQIFWLADNETVILNDRCNGTIKKINTTTKSVQLFNPPAQGYYALYLFYSEQLPEFAFYLDLSRNAMGGASEPWKLYSLNLTTGNSVLIKDSITQNPAGGGYTMGNKKLAIKSASQTLIQTLVINLEQATSQMLPISGNVRAFSPDDTKMLIYSSVAPITATVYDFTCQCTQPRTLADYSNPLWRTQGIYGYNINSPRNLQYVNLESGALLKSFTGLRLGPWAAQNGSLAVLFAEGTNYAIDNVCSLVAYDFITGQTKEIATGLYGPFPYSIDGIYLAAVSPNQKKVAYAQSGPYLRVSVL